MIHTDRNGRTLIGHGVHIRISISMEESFKWDTVASISSQIVSQMVLRKVGLFCAKLCRMELFLDIKHLKCEEVLLKHPFRIF